MGKSKILSATANCRFPKNIDKNKAWALVAQAFTDGAQYGVESKAELKYVNAGYLTRIGRKSHQDPVEVGDIFKYRSGMSRHDSYLQITNWNQGKSLAFNSVSMTQANSVNSPEAQLYAHARTEVILNEGFENVNAVIRFGMKTEKPSFLGNLKDMFQNISKKNIAKRLEYGITLNGSADQDKSGTIILEGARFFDHVVINPDSDENILKF